MQGKISLTICTSPQLLAYDRRPHATILVLGPALRTTSSHQIDIIETTCVIRLKVDESLMCAGVDYDTPVNAVFIYVELRVGDKTFCEGLCICIHTGLYSEGHGTVLFTDAGPSAGYRTICDDDFVRDVKDTDDNCPMIISRGTAGDTAPHDITASFVYQSLFPTQFIRPTTQRTANVTPLRDTVIRAARQILGR